MVVIVSLVAIAVGAAVIALVMLIRKPRLCDLPIETRVIRTAFDRNTPTKKGHNVYL